MDMPETMIALVHGERCAAGVASALVHGSMWFELTPLPDDEWRFTFKTDRRAFAVGAIEAEKEKAAACKWRCSVCGGAEEDHPLIGSGPRRDYCRF